MTKTQTHRQNTLNSQHMIYFWNSDYSLIPNMTWWSSCYSPVTLVTLITLVTLVTLVTMVTLITLVTLVTLITLATLVTLVILVTLVTLFRSANQFYRAECITILGFFSCLLQTNQDQVFPSHMVGKIWPQEHLIPLSLSKKRPKKLILKDGLPVAVGELNLQSSIR